MFGSLPSSYFYISNSKNDGDNTYNLSETIALKGKGFGHGVGLCQVGTLQKARADWKWEDILKLYFPGVTFSKDWLAKQTPNFLTNGME
jgi:stage II sporulation protein D